MRQADLIRGFLAGEFFFGGPYHRNLWDGIDPVRDEMGGHFAGLAKHVAACQAALLHGGAGQSGKADDVAGGIDVRNAGLEVFIDGKLAAHIGLDASRFYIELVAVGLTSYGVQESLPANELPAFELGEYLVALLVKADLHDLLAETKNGSNLPQL